MRNKIYGFLVLLLFSFSSMLFAMGRVHPPLSATESDGLRQVFNECKQEQDKDKRETCVKDGLEKLQAKNPSLLGNLNLTCTQSCIFQPNADAFIECLKKCMP